MSGALEKRLADALARTPWSAQAGRLAELLGESEGVSGALLGAPDAPFRGVARAVASSADAARFLAHRSGLARRSAGVGPGWAARRAAELDGAPSQAEGDLEDFLDVLRLLRREETLLAAACDLGGLAPFSEASVLLSSLAEAIARRTLARAHRTTPSAPDLGVVAMGKLGGREFTYQSDLDLIFLHGGDTDAIHAASRLAQRFIQYVSTMTGAGVAYAVDARLRPSGRQGTLVASFASFERYQREEAALWEHLALVRARPVAGPIERTRRTLDAVRARVFGRCNPWPDVADMRARVEAQRADESLGIELKTGPGGLMDAEFLAQGAALELGDAAPRPDEPSIPALLAAATPAAAGVTRAYGFLRVVEARARWIAGRSVERLPQEEDGLDRVAELVEPGLRAQALLARIAAARGTLRAAFQKVARAGTIRALEG